MDRNDVLPFFGLWCPRGHKVNVTECFKYVDFKERRKLSGVSQSTTMEDTE